MRLVITLSFITLVGIDCMSSDDTIKNSTTTVATKDVSNVVVKTTAVDQFTEKENGEKPYYCFPRFRAILVGKAYEGTIDLLTVRDRAVAVGLYVLEHDDNDTLNPVYLHIEQGGAGYALGISISEKSVENHISLDGCGDVSLLKDQYKTLFNQLGLDSAYLDRLYFEEKKIPNTLLID